MAHTIEVARIEPRDPGVERGVDGGDTLRLVGGAIQVGHAHAAQTERGDAGAVKAERAGHHNLFLLRIPLFHGVSLSGSTVKARRTCYADGHVPYSLI